VTPPASSRTTTSVLGSNPSFSSVFVYEFEAGSFFNPNSMTPRASSGERVGAYRAGRCFGGTWWMAIAHRTEKSAAVL
jgi:hypothetical protein